MTLRDGKVHSISPVFAPPGIGRNNCHQVSECFRSTGCAREGAVIRGGDLSSATRRSTPPIHFGPEQVRDFSWEQHGRENF
jgi:hypothetical protein